MPEIYRIVEITLYSLVNFLPYLVLAIYPFRNQLRFSKKITGIIICILCIFQIFIGITVCFFKHQYASFFALISTILYFCFYLICIKAHNGKILFLLLILSNLGNFIVVSSKCLEGLLFPELVTQNYRWSFTLIMIIIQIIILVPIFLFMKKNYAQIFNQRYSTYLWNYLWLIPATFYLIWYYTFYYNTEMSSLEIALHPGNTILMLFINLGAFLIYYIISIMISEHSKVYELETINHNLEIQALQYNNLQDKISDAKKTQFEINSLITMLAGYIEYDNYPALKEYVYNYLQSKIKNSSKHFCENYALNVLIEYFYQIANDNNILFDCNINIPKDISISDVDLSVIIANILENAINSCITSKNSTPHIIMKGTIENNCILFTIDSTFTKHLFKVFSSMHLSTLPEKDSMLILSALNIVNRYNGVLTTEYRNDMLFVSVMIKA